MTKVKKFGALSVGKICGLVYAVIAFIIGFFVTVFALISVATATGEEKSAFGSILFGVGAIIFLPILYGVLGFIGGVISAWIYNVAARWIGGIEVELEEERKVQ